MKAKKKKTVRHFGDETRVLEDMGMPIRRHKRRLTCSGCGHSYGARYTVSGKAEPDTEREECQACSRNPHHVRIKDNYGI